MKENLDNMERFLKYNLSIKNILYDTMPKESDKYNQNSIIEYSDKLFKVINDIEYYINVILDKYNFIESDKEYFKKFIEALKHELIESGYNYDKLKKIYEICFSNMNEELVSEVGQNCVGYKMFRGVNLSKAKSFNEILHVIHQTIINDQNILKSLPKLSGKKNSENSEIALYGKENVAAKTIYESFPQELSCGNVDIVSLSNDRVIMMIRDRGHALSIEIEKENDVYYVNYFIPKIINVDMVNNLKGVRKVNNDSFFTTGIFETSLEDLSFNLIDFISKVPTDFDSPHLQQLLEERGIQR